LIESIAIREARQYLYAPVDLRMINIYAKPAAIQAERARNKTCGRVNRSSFTSFVNNLRAAEPPLTARGCGGIASAKNPIAGRAGSSALNLILIRRLSSETIESRDNASGRLFSLDRGEVLEGQSLSTG
jgi:hypothetical protein